MSSDRHRLFEQLEPPAGGAEQLGQRLDRAEERRGPGRRLVVASSAAVVVAFAAAVMLLEPERRTQSDRDPEPDQVVASLYEAPQFDRLLGRPLDRTEPRVRLNDQAAKVAEIRTANENVRLYRLE